jgi:hypothetical protein
LRKDSGIIGAAASRLAGASTKSRLHIHKNGEQLLLRVDNRVPDHPTGE